METGIIDALFYKKKTLALLNENNLNQALDRCAELLKFKVDSILYFPLENDIDSINCGFKLRQLCSIYNTLLFVFSRCDIANIIDSNGVVLDEKSVRVQDARKILNHDSLVATSYLSYDADFILTDKFQKNIKYQFIKDKNLYTLFKGDRI